MNTPTNKIETKKDTAEIGLDVEASESQLIDQMALAIAAIARQLYAHAKGGLSNETKNDE